ncbi:MAG: hypothetical protein V3V49_13555 [Candidatus Krumholzibacteria bacterium]
MKNTRWILTALFSVGAGIGVSSLMFTDVTAAKKKDVKSKPAAEADSTMKLEAGTGGTIFKSLRIEGEDRVRIEFERPALNPNLDPTSAPGLEWESVRAVLSHSGLDLVSPYITRSATQRPPFYARPWLDHFSTRGVARFRPVLEGVDRWRLNVANSQGETVARFEGKGKPPKEITWDGRSLDGKPAPPGLTYTYVLEAFDRAGNKRNFLGDGFELPSYRLNTPEGFTMLFSGDKLSAQRPASAQAGGDEPAPAILLEAASWINQRPNSQETVRVEVTARSFSDAKQIAGSIIEQLRPLLLGDPARLKPIAAVQNGAPDRGSVAIVVGPPPAPAE